MARFAATEGRSARIRQALDDLGAALVKGLPIESLLGEATEIMARTLQADRWAAFLGPPIRPVAASGLSAAYLESIVADYRRGPGGVVETTGRPLYVNDVTDTDQPPTWIRDAARREGFRALVLVPLVCAGTVVGGLSFYHDRPATHDDDDRAFVAWCAASLALAVEASHRDDEVAHNRRLIDEILEDLPIGVLVTGATAPEFANRVARLVLANRQIAHALSAVVDREGKPFQPRANPIDRGLAGESVDATEVSIRSAPGVVTTYIVRSRPLAGRSLTLFEDVTRTRDIEVFKDAVIQIASHALRTPLTALRLSVHSLERRTAADGGDGRALHIIARHVDRLADLVDHFLAAAELEAHEELNVEELDLGSVVEGAVADVKTRRPTDRRITVTGTAPPVEGDGALLRQAVAELVDNAVEHGAGEVDVEIGVDHDVDVVRVSDRGPGVPGERVADLFERFNLARAALPGGGLGLGLFVAAAIARRHGGRLGYEARDGGGACFSIVLPRRHVRASPPPLAVEAAQLQ